MANTYRRHCSPCIDQLFCFFAHKQYGAFRRAISWISIWYLLKGQVSEKSKYASEVFSMNFVKVFRESLSYLRKIKTYIYLAAGLFLFGAIIGFFSSSQLGFLDELLKNLAKQAEGLNTREIIWFIFQNNLKSAFFTMILGVFLGIFPVINALTNGVLLGYVFSRVSAIDGWVSLWKIFPHGIFELPAVFIAMGLGMSMGFGF